MTVSLVLAQLLALACILASDALRYYRVLLIFLSVAAFASIIPRDWYAVTIVTVTVLRLAAVIEVSFRQIEGFRGWPWLVPMICCGATVITCASCWSEHGSGLLAILVEIRRMWQVWEAAALVMLELWWGSKAGLYRSKDWIAVALTLSCASHGLVSFAAGAWGWSAEAWSIARSLSTLADCLVYVSIGIIFRAPSVVWTSLLNLTVFARSLWRGLRPAFRVSR